MQAGVYRHYKGGYYQVLGVAEHTETKELMVVYVSLTGAHMPGPRMRVRPYSMFMGEVDGGKRFEYVGDEILLVASAEAPKKVDGRTRSGKARMALLSPEERHQFGKAGAAVRWAFRSTAPKTSESTP